MSLVGYRQSQNTARHGDADGNGEGADHQGQEELHTADCHRAEGAEEKPACGFFREGAFQSCDFAADVVQKKDPQIAKQRHPYSLRQLPEIQSRERDGRGQKAVPVVTGMLQTPQIGAVSTDQRGHEEVAQKERMLCPQTEPLVFQDSNIEQIVTGAEESGYDRKRDKGQPHRTPFQLEPFRTDGFYI